MDRGSPPTSSSGSASPICHAGAAPTKPKTATAASASGCLSPAPCSNAPAPRSRSPTGSFRITAPWFRSRGPAANSKPVKSIRNRLFRTALKCHAGEASDFVRPWQRPLATPYDEMSDERIPDPVNAIAELTDHADRSLLIVEDDKPFLERLSRAMETRGFMVTSCDSVSDGLTPVSYTHLTLPTIYSV